MAIRTFEELSGNNRLRIFQVSVFIKAALGVIDPEKETETDLRDIVKTPKEWRRFRKDLFHRANRIRGKLGLARLGA